MPATDTGQGGADPRRVVWFAGLMPMAAATFRSRLVARERLYGAWSLIPSLLSVRLLATAGLDYVVIDLQHGGAAEADLPAMTSAIRLAGATPVARVRYSHTADIGRAPALGGGRGPLPARGPPGRGRRAGRGGAVLPGHGRVCRRGRRTRRDPGRRRRGR